MKHCMYIRNRIIHVLSTLVAIFIKILCKGMKTKIAIVMWCLVTIIGILFLRLHMFEPEKAGVEYPLILWWSSDFPGTSKIRTCNNINCEIQSQRNISDQYFVEAYLFYGSSINFEDLPEPPSSKISWGLFHEESPRNTVELMHESAMKLFNFTATFSRYSDVPFPFQYLDSIEDITDLKYYVTTREKNLLLNLTDVSPVLYIQSDCSTMTERDEYVRELMKFIHIDSYGECLNNKEIPEQFKEGYLSKLDDSSFLHFVARYKFVIAIENGVCDDYITEKFWRAIKVGSVPIYYGSPTIKDWLPNNKSAILIQDYPTPEILSNHLKKLLKDDKLYEEHLEHKTKQLIFNKKVIKELKDRPYQTDTLKTVEEFECYICKKLHERRKGSTYVYKASKKHYDCPKPTSMLNISESVENSWLFAWQLAGQKAREVYNKILT